MKYNKTTFEIDNKISSTTIIEHKEGKDLEVIKIREDKVKNEEDKINEIKRIIEGCVKHYIQYKNIESIKIEIVEKEPEEKEEWDI
jgi:hypothetical protein